MPVLLSSPASPFARKARIAIALCGLAHTIEIRAADTGNPSDPLHTHNPLGKIPVLILHDDTAIHDSPVIAEWADHEAGGGRIIPAGSDRFHALTRQALADGIMEASLAVVYENRFRPQAKRDQQWINRQEGKTARGLTALDAAPPDLSETANIGAIATACALGYRDLRFGPEWRGTYPDLAEWHAEFARRVPAYGETAPAVA